MVAKLWRPMVIPPRRAVRCRAGAMTAQPVLRWMVSRCAAPSSVGGKGVDAGGALGEVDSEIGEDSSLTARGGGVEVGDAQDDSVVG